MEKYLCYASHPRKHQIKICTVFRGKTHYFTGKVTDLLPVVLERINICMRITEIESPKTPEQQRLDQLKATSDRATNAVKQERQRQKIQKAQKTLQTLRQPSSATLKPIKPV